MRPLREVLAALMREHTAWKRVESGQALETSGGLWELDSGVVTALLCIDRMVGMSHVWMLLCR